MEYEILPDGQRNFRTLFQFQIAENRVEDANSSLGTAPRVMGISQACKSASWKTHAQGAGANHGGLRMITLQLMACVSLIAGAFILLGLSPAEFTGGCSPSLTRRPGHRDEINEAVKRKTEPSAPEIRRPRISSPSPDEAAASFDLRVFACCSPPAQVSPSFCKTCSSSPSWRWA